MGGIVCQLVCPALFESDVADTEICLTVGKVYKLLGRRVVGLRACTFGNHADYCEMIAGNGFGKIPQWFKGNSNDGFVVAVLALVASWFAGSCQYSCKQ